MTDTDERVPALPPDARRDSVIFMILLGVTALLYLLSIPWAFGMGLTGALAAFFASRSLYRARRARGVTVWRVSMSAGIAVSLFSMVMSLTFAVFSDVVTDLRDCMGRAVTQQAQTECQAEYEEGVQTTLEDIAERLGVTLPE